MYPQAGGSDDQCQCDKGVHEFLGEHGLEPKPDERFSDVVARALHISAGQADVLLEALSSGATPEQALTKAEIDRNVADSALSTRMAQAIGKAWGEISKRV